ncbi:MAG: Hpt domain-containing protein [Deltaproteobacteria bacterium]|jgi:chemotaxis protein histidine kinase CheA|nr:Hpt domain-containing protein [Deltaproteobacteria bacterium]
MSNDILEEFIFDSREHLVNAGAQLLALEKAPQSLADLNALMGTLHSIKGNSGFLNLRNLYNLLHASETLLQTVREIGCLCPPSVIEELFQVLDTAEVIMGRLENGENDAVEWLPALSEALKETELALESSQAAVASLTEVAPSSNQLGQPDPRDLLAPTTATPTTSLAPTTSIDPSINQIDDPDSAPISLGQLVTLANGQLASGGRAFLANCQTAIQNGQTSLALDLTNLSQLSSPELELLTNLGQVYGEGLALVLDQERQPDFYRVLEVLDLVESFQLYPDPDSALSALGA